MLVDGYGVYGGLEWVGVGFGCWEMVLRGQGEEEGEGDG